MVHDAVDIERWKSMFVLEALRSRAREFVAQRQAEDPSHYPDQDAVDRHVALMGPKADAVTSPYDIAVVELLREETRERLSLDGSRSVPADVFVFSRGESPKRELTKVGGLPYWPRGKKWPRRFLGKPMTFIAQLCFADSKDIAGSLPGDILLMFAEVESAHGCHPDRMSFHWMQLGEEDLITQDDMPETGVRITPCWGAIHRTVDYGGFLDGDGPVRVSRDDCHVAVIEGTKIGGLPHWVQCPERLSGRFLASLGSIQPAYEQAFPWLNVPEPIASFSDSIDHDALMFGDVGTLYLFVDNKGGVHWTVQCY